MQQSKPKFTEDEIEDVRKQVKALKIARNYTNAQIAREAGVAKSTLSQFLSANYPGDSSSPAQLLSQWLINHAENEEMTAKIGKQGGFVETQTSERIWQVLRYCMAASDMGAIISIPGCGKTITAKSFAAQNARCYYLSISHTSGDVTPMLARLVETMRCESVNNSRLMRRVVDFKLVSASSLLIIDEAQHLTGRALEELRSIHDETACGLVLMGNSTVITRISGPAQAAQFAQLISRIGMRLNLPRPPKEDVEKIAHKLGEFDDKALEYLVKISKTHGAMRTVVKTIKLARMYTPKSEKRISLETLQAAYSQRS